MRAAELKCSKTQQACQAQSNFRSCRLHEDQASCALPLSSPPTTSQTGRTSCFICTLLTWKVGPPEALRLGIHASMLGVLQPDSIFSHHESAFKETASSKLALPGCAAQAHSAPL